MDFSKFSDGRGVCVHHTHWTHCLTYPFGYQVRVRINVIHLSEGSFYLGYYTFTLDSEYYLSEFSLHETVG